MTLAQKKIFINVVLVDAGGNKATVSLSTDYADMAALAAADVTGDIVAIVNHLGACTDAVVAGYSVGVQWAEDADFFADAGVEVENLALVVAIIDGEPGKTVTLRIPAPTDSLFMAATGKGRNKIDPADADLLAYLEHFSSDGELLVSDGELIADPAVTGNIDGKRIHRGSRKG